MNNSLSPCIDYDTDLQQNARTARTNMHFHPFVKLPPAESVSVCVENIRLANSMSKRRFSDFWFIHKGIFREHIYQVNFQDFAH